MHNTEHKPLQEELASTPAQKGTPTTGKQKLPRAWRYIIKSGNPLQATTAISSLLWNTFQNVPAEQIIPQKEGLSSVYAIRASDGKILWHYAMNNGKNSWASWLSVENGVVYASTNTDTNGTQGLGISTRFKVVTAQSSGMISSTDLLVLHCSLIIPSI